MFRSFTPASIVQVRVPGSSLRSLQRITSPYLNGTRSVSKLTARPNFFQSALFSVSRSLIRTLQPTSFQLNTVRSQWTDAFTVSRLFSKPKGFGRFTKQSEDDENKSDKDEPKSKEKSGKSDESIDFNAFFRRKKKGDDDNESPAQPTPPIIPLLLVFGILLYIVMQLIGDRVSGEEITFQQFRADYLARGLVKSIVIVDDRYARVITASESNTNPQFSKVYFTIGSVDSFERHFESAQRDMGVQPQDFIPIRYTKDNSAKATEILGSVVFYSILIAGGVFLFRNLGSALKSIGGRDNPYTKAKATLVTREMKVPTKFADVAGLDEAKAEVMEFVSFLKQPERFTKLGAKLPKGALLVGPPGTGKTMLARATAGESGVPFLSMSGSDFLELFVGVGPARVRDLFKQARKNAPCIVFIDEIDAIGRARGKASVTGGHEERENTLNQLLVEMDGFKQDVNIVILAGTNRADVLDPALVRPGRFDRQILVDKPDIRGRREIFEVYLKKLKLALGVPELAQRLAALTPGFVGADIANVSNEAAIIAARRQKEVIELDDFEAAVDRVIGGLEKKNKVMSKEERETVAYHEAGHAVAGWFFEHADPLLKVTIVPRGASSLGYAQYLPQELALFRENQLLDKICMALGGRVAEQIIFGQISTGAANDLDKVTKMAYAYVQTFGMSKRLGHVSFQSEEQFAQKPYSEKTHEIIDEEAAKIIADSYERTVTLLTEKKSLIEALAKRLLQDETINHDVIVSVLGPRPYETNTYREYVKEAGKKEWLSSNNKPNTTEEPSATKQDSDDSGSGGLPVAAPASS